jgi:flagellar biosynthesis/type III secretory pathway protein FliH
MARMRMAPGERWQVKAAALKQLLGLTLTAEQQRMLGAFISIYLPLNAHETARFDADVATWQLDTKEHVVEFISEWEQKGIEKGIAIGLDQGVNQGQQALLIRRLTRRYGPLPADVQTAITRLRSAELLALDDALWDFTTLEDVQGWLAQR